MIISQQLILWKPLFVSPTKTVESLWIDFWNGWAHMAIVTTDSEKYRRWFDQNSWRDSFVLSESEVKTIESINHDDDEPDRNS